MDKSVLFAALKPRISESGIEGFFIRQLSVAEVESIRTAMKTDGNSDSFGSRLVISSVVDELGQNVLSVDDMASLQSLSNELMDKLTGKALELNGFIKAPEAKN